MTSIPLGKVIYAFEIGMKNMSAKNADVLAEHFGSLTKLVGVSKEELMAVGNLQFPGDREKNINKMLEYWMPFNEPLERLKQPERGGYAAVGCGDLCVGYTRD